MVWGGTEGCRHEWGDVLPGRPGNIDGGLAFTGTGAPETGLPRLIEAGSGTSSAGRFCLRCNAWLGSLGNEPRPELYVQHLVEIFREVRRVLRADGTCWLNLGDSYAAAGYSNHRNTGGITREQGGRQKHSRVPGLKPKDMVGIPWRVAFALQADGWWLRSDIIWHKPNPMPESVTDRPTKSHEYLFLLSRSKFYFYDQNAIREEASPASIARINQPNFANQTGGEKDYRTTGINPIRSARQILENFAKNPGRNRRTVWTIPPKPYKGAHFATFPPALVEPCIKAGTSERGVCPECGAPWERVVEKGHVTSSGGQFYKLGDARHPTGGGGNVVKAGGMPEMMVAHEHITTGWRPTCSCPSPDEGFIVYEDGKRYHAPIPATILDPFVGSGTTLEVARSLGRSGIGLDLSFPYLKDQATPRLALDRLRAWGERPRPGDGESLDALPLFFDSERR